MRQVGLGWRYGLEDSGYDVGAVCGDEMILMSMSMRMRTRMIHT